MKLQTLNLLSFRSSVRLQLSTAASRVLIAGLNGTGKSSIRDAVQWILRGSCPGTDAKGGGWESLIPVGETALEAAVIIEGIGAVHRGHVNGMRSFLVEGVQGEPSLHQAALYAKLQVDPAYIDACLDTGKFLSLHHSDAKELVLALLDVKIPVEEELLTLDQLETRYDRVFDERKIAKIKLKQAVVSPKPDEGHPPMPTLDDIDVQLAARRAELKALTSGAGVSAGKRDVLEQRLAEAQHFEVGTIAPPEVQRQIAELEEADAQEQASVVPVQATNQARIFGLRSTIEALKAATPKKGCVIEAGVECPVAKIKFTNRAKELEQQLPQGGDVAQTPLPGPLAAREERRTRLASLRSLLAAHEALQARNAARLSEAEALRAQLSSIGDTAQATEQIQTLEARIEKGELLKRRARDYWTTHEQHVLSVRAKDKAEKEVARLEEACEVLGPNGARVPALEAALGAFLAKINPFTEAFGWTVTIQVDPWQVNVNGRPVETYSESEQFRIGVAIQLAIAEISGLSFAIVDRLDILDVPGRKQVSQMLMASPLEQVFILATREPEQALPSGADLIAYRFAKQDGRTVIAERTG